MSGCSVTSVERKVNALLGMKCRVYRAFIFKLISTCFGSCGQTTPTEHVVASNPSELCDIV